MKYRLILTAILGAFMAAALSSCEKVIEFKGEETAPYVVMVSAPESDSTWHVRLTYSRFFLSNSDIRTIDKATFTLKVNGVETPANATSLGNGNYTMGYIPRSGDTLFLSVDIPGEKSVSAGCRIPARPVIDNIQYIPNNDGYPKLKFCLHDPAGQRNYYMVRLLYRVVNYPDTPDEEYSSWYEQHFTIEDNVIFDQNISEDVFDLGDDEPENTGTTVYFSDERINGTDHNITLSSWMYGGYQYRLDIIAVDYSYYLYQKTLGKARNQSEFSILSEPVQILSNVNNGVGVLGGKATLSVDVSSYIPEPDDEDTDY